MVTDAFDMADRYRMPVMLLADGLLGQMMEPVTFGEEKKAESDYDKSWATNGHENKRKHNIITSLYLKPDQLEKTVRDRFERYEEIERDHAKGVSYLTEDADIVIVGYGATARISKSAVDMARKQGIKAGLFRPQTLWPFPVKLINDACKQASDVLCVEMSMGQMIDDVKLALECRLPVHFFGRTGGVIPTPAEICDKILEIGGAK